MGYNSWVYFPGNGSLLSAIAMMAGGWEGRPYTYAPGFPKNGKWNVKVEGFNKNAIIDEQTGISHYTFDGKWVNF